MARYIAIEVNNTRLNCMCKSSFFDGVSGFGFSHEYDFESPVNGFFYNTSSKVAQGNISGSIEFINRGSQYSDYRAFTEIINSSDVLKFVYRPYGTQEFYIDVMITRMEKSEINENGYLECPVEFVCLTPFYSEGNSIAEFPPEEEGQSKTYSYTYSYGYATSRTNGAVNLDVGGDYDGSIEIRIINYIASPVVTIQGQESDDIYAYIDLTGVTIEDGESLIYSSVPNKSGIWRLNSDKKRVSLIDQVTLHEGIDLFPQLPRNTSMTAVLQGTRHNDTSATIKTYKYYKTR